MPRSLRIALASIIAIAALAQIFLVGLTNDTDMLMHTTAHMLYDGGLYTRWITVNPPVIFFIYTIPVILSVKFGVPASVALHGFTTLLCCISLAIIRRLLRGHDPEAREPWLEASAITLFLAPCIFHTFGDREHYLFIFALPWMLQMLLLQPPRVFTAALAMVGFFLKPYNLLLLPVLTLFGGPAHWSLREKLLSPSARATAGLFVLFFILLYVFFPAYPHILSIAILSYSMITYPLATRVQEALIWLPVAIALIALNPPDPRRTCFYAFACTLALVYCFNAGWIYLGYILAVPVILACPLLRFRQLAAGIAACFLLLSVFSIGRDAYYTVTTGQTYYHSHFQAAFKAEILKNVQRYFLLFSTTLWSSNLAPLQSPYHSLSPFDDGPWPLAWIGRHKDDEKTAAIMQDTLVEPVLAALKRNPVLIVDDSPGQSSNLFKIIAKDAQMCGALRGYMPIGTVDHCANESDVVCRFTLWRKMGDAVPH